MFRIKNSAKMLKHSLRQLYKAIPFKRRVYLALRSVYTPPRAVYDHLYFEGPFQARLFGAQFVMINHNTDLETLVFWGGENGYEPQTLRLWARACHDANVIFDIGANVGLYSLLARGVNPRAQLYAFEPIERFCDQMRENARRSGFDWHMYTQAVSDRDGEAIIYDLPLVQHRHASLVREEASHASKTLIERRVQMARLDTFARENDIAKIDLIKLDVEGFECQVLDGLGAQLRAMRPMLLVEIKSGEHAARIQTLLAGLNYAFFNIHEVKGPRRVSALTENGAFQVARECWNFFLCPTELAWDLSQGT